MCATRMVNVADSTILAVRGEGNVKVLYITSSPLKIGRINITSTSDPLALVLLNPASRNS
jgi:hypothetical protein